jgi:hypothetical protein
VIFKNICHLSFYLLWYCEMLLIESLYWMFLPNVFWRALHTFIHGCVNSSHIEYLIYSTTGVYVINVQAEYEPAIWAFKSVQKGSICWLWAASSIGNETLSLDKSQQYPHFTWYTFVAFWRRVLLYNKHPGDREIQGMGYSL